MNAISKGFPLLIATSLVGACGTSIYSVRIPLAENPELLNADPPHVTIEDRRPESERSTHVGPKLFRCERWYGDDTFQPAKLVALEQLIAQRVPAATAVTVRLDRFDTIEYCENTASRAGAAGAAGASAAAGVPLYVPALTEPGGDSVHLRLTGAINGAPFDVARAFDYDGLPVKFPDMPSANPRYRTLLWSAMGEIADEIVAKMPTPVP